MKCFSLFSAIIPPSVALKSAREPIKHAHFVIDPLDANRDGINDFFNKLMKTL